MAAHDAGHDGDGVGSVRGIAEGPKSASAHEWRGGETKPHPQRYGELKPTKRSRASRDATRIEARRIRQTEPRTEFAVANSMVEVIRVGLRLR